MLTAHVGPFAEVGAVYAPLYRQAAIFAFATFRDDAKAAIKTAYTDVERAFDVYLRDHHRGRAIVLVGVGQGALHALRLLETRLQAEPYRERLVAAYLIEGAVPQVMVQSRLAATPVCTRADQFGCLVSWVSAPDPTEAELATILTRSRYWTPEGEVAATAGEQLVCVNPLLWSTAEDYAPERLHVGGAVARQVPFGTATPAVLPRETSAQCMNGVLLTDRPHSRELQPSGLGSSLKTPVFNLFYADLQRNVAARAAAAVAWLEANGRRPVEPLPPLESLEDAPITLPRLP
jgi:pimeloyl-ACP methyl ester carboxylesterase